MNSWWLDPLAGSEDEGINHAGSDFSEIHSVRVTGQKESLRYDVETRMVIDAINTMLIMIKGPDLFQ